MSAELKVLQAGPELVLRQETVDCPELGGAVICRGLMASEVFAVTALRGQALQPVNDARAEYQDRLAALPPGATPPAFEAPALGFSELKVYGSYVCHLLACGVVTPSGLAMYTAQQWELADQHYPGLTSRLQAVVERLSGMRAEDVEKNSPATPR